jgi:hypothetical protein
MYQNPGPSKRRRVPPEVLAIIAVVLTIYAIAFAAA